MAATMEAAIFIMFNMHACVCAHACTCMCAHVHGRCPHPTPPPPTHPPTPQGGTPQISKNAIRLERIQDISIPFKDLESLENSPPMGGVFFGGWVGGLVGRKM